MLTRDGMTQYLGWRRAIGTALNELDALLMAEDIIYTDAEMLLLVFKVLRVLDQCYRQYLTHSEPLCDFEHPR